MKSSRILLLVIIGLGLIVSGCGGGGRTVLNSYSVSGRVTDYSGQGIGGVTLAFSSGEVATTNTDGFWSKSGLKGVVEIHPTKPEYEFYPKVTEVVTNNNDVVFIALTRSTISVQDLIDSAQNGDIITLPPGIYTDSIDFRGKEITLQSEDPSDSLVKAITIIDADSKGPVAIFQNGEGEKTTLRGLTLRNGTGQSRDLKRCGGALFINGASPTITGNIIANNEADCAGAAFIFDHSSARISGNIIRGNKSRGYGGAIYMGGGSTPTVDNNTFEDNEGGYGGAIAVSGGSTRPLIVDNTFRRNAATGNGGAIDIGGYANAFISGNTISESTAGQGGALHVYFGAMEAYNNQIVNNTSDGHGGGISIDSAFRSSLVGNVVDRNTAGYDGGGLYLYKTLSIVEGNTFSCNSSAGYGGGVFLLSRPYSPETLCSVVTDNKFTDNTASVGAGLCVMSQASLTMTSNTFQGNNAQSNGGGIWVSATSQLLDNQGVPLPVPDTLNQYNSNTPDDICYE